MGQATEFTKEDFEAMEEQEKTLQDRIGESIKALQADNIEGIFIGIETDERIQVIRYHDSGALKIAVAKIGREYHREILESLGALFESRELEDE